MCRQSGKGFSQKFKNSIFLAFSTEKIRLNNYSSMGFIPGNRVRTYINSVLDLCILISIGSYVTNLPYFLGDKGNNPILFTDPGFFGIEIS